METNYRALTQRARTIHSWVSRFLEIPPVTDRSILRELREARDMLNAILAKGDQADAHSKQRSVDEK